jgi:hypothetical protein
MKIFQKGLTGNAIKIAGVILMVFDHVHQMFWAQGAPNLFNWLGRPVLPIFLFMCAEGFYHTRSRKRYLLQLAAGFVFMNAGNMALSFIMPNDNVMLFNNVFSTMLLTAIYLLFIEKIREGVKEKQAKKVALWSFLMALPIIYAATFVIYLDALPIPAIFALSFIPNIMATEGGFTALILGVLFYLFREKRLIQIFFLAALSALSFITGLASGNMQWLMIFASIPIMLYNGKRGEGSKYFFYIFYPAHIYLFYVIAWLII